MERLSSFVSMVAQTYSYSSSVGMANFSPNISRILLLLINEVNPYD
jgi:hypothetical protein